MKKQKVITEDNILIVDKSKPKRHGRLDASKRWLTTLLYLTPLEETMNYIVPFYWEPPKRILDVTAGQRLMWKKFPLKTPNISTGKYEWTVDFADISKDADVDIIADAREIDKHIEFPYNIGVADFPFIEIDKGMESFGVLPRNYQHGLRKRETPHLRREFYFRYFVPPEIIFKETVQSFNKAFTDGLIIKMGDSHANHVLIPNHLFAMLNFDHRFNKNSKFFCVDQIYYRGNYAKRGANMPYAQSVVTHLLIFKKDPTAR